MFVPPLPVNGGGGDKKIYIGILIRYYANQPNADNGVGTKYAG